MLFRYIFVLFFIFLFTACSTFNTEENKQEEKKRTYLRLASATPVLHSMAEALTQGTMIKTVYIAPKRFSIKRLPGWLARIDAADFPEVDAVIGISSTWPSIDIYPYLRAQNIAVIPIDAAEALVPGGERVTIAPSNNTTLPYFWLDPANALLMLGIIQRDLITLVRHAELTEKSRAEEVKHLQGNYQKISASLRAGQIRLEQSLLDANVVQVIADKAELSALAGASLLPVVTLDEALQELQPSLFITNKKLRHKSLQGLPPHIKIWSIDDFARQREGSFTQRWTGTFSRLP